MVVQVMVIAEAVQVGPGLQPPFELVIDARMARIIEHRPVEAGLQPTKRRMRVLEQIAREVICGHVVLGRVEPHDQFSQDRVRRLRPRQRMTHQDGRPKRGELGLTGRGHGAQWSGLAALKAAF